MANIYRTWKQAQIRQREDNNYNNKTNDNVGLGTKPTTDAIKHNPKPVYEFI